MKTLFTILCSISVIGMLSAQEMTSRSFAVKNNFSVKIKKGDVNYLIANNEGFQKDSVESVEIKLVRPAFNIFTKKGNLHEFEIVDFKFGEEETVHTYIFQTRSGLFITGTFGEAMRKTTQLGFRYQYGFGLIKRKCQLYLGGGFQTFFEKNETIPMDQIDPLTGSNIQGIISINKKMGINFHVVPKLIIPLNEKWFLDIHTLFGVYKVGQVNSQQSQSLLNSQMVQIKANQSVYFPKVYEVSIGIGYKFSGKKL